MLLTNGLSLSPQKTKITVSILRVYQEMVFRVWIYHYSSQSAIVIVRGGVIFVEGSEETGWKGEST